MPGDAIVELFQRPIFEVILQITGYYTSRLLFPVITFGYITVAPVKNGVIAIPKWRGINRASGGKIVLHEEMGALLGIMLWSFLLGMGILYLK